MLKSRICGNLRLADLGRFRGLQFGCICVCLQQFVFRDLRPGRVFCQTNRAFAHQEMTRSINPIDSFCGF